MSNNWEREMDKMLSAFDDQAMTSLANIRNCFEQSGGSFSKELRKYLLTVSTDR